MKKLRNIILSLLGIGVGAVAVGQFVDVPNDFGTAEDYRNGTILIVKPICNEAVTDCSLSGTYKAGDIISARDGEETFQQFNTRDFLGVSEKKEYLIFYLPKKLTADERQALTTPEYDSDFTEDGLKTADQIATNQTGRVIRRRGSGVAFQNVLSQSELLTAALGKGIGKVKTVQETEIQTKDTGEVSVVRFPVHVQILANAKREMNRITQSIIPFVYAQTVVTKRIDPDNGTCDGAAADYTSMSGWEAQNLNLVTLDQIQDARFCSTAGTDDTTTVLINGWTTSATQYIDAYTVAAYRHSGTWDSTKYVLAVGSATALDIRTGFMRVTGFQIETTTANVVLNAQGQTADNSDLRFAKNIFRGPNVAGNYSVFTLSDADIISKVWNNEFIHRGSRASGNDRVLSMVSATTTLYNNTVHGGQTGIRTLTSGTTTAINNVVMYQGSAGFTESAGTRQCLQFNVSMDATADDQDADPLCTSGNNQISITEASVSFVSTSTGNFHLNSDTVLNGDGLDLSADVSLAFSDDIDAETRSAWEIGADELTIAASSPPATRQDIFMFDSPDL